MQLLDKDQNISSCALGLRFSVSAWTLVLALVLLSRVKTNKGYDQAKPVTLNTSRLLRKKLFLFREFLEIFS